MTPTVDIGILLPEVLSTYSDAGNANVLLQRMRWRGIPARIVLCTAAAAPPTTCDIYLIGGGEDTAQLFAMQWLRTHPTLCAALETKAITLAICAGFQILGHSIVDRAGTRHAGAGILDISTTPGRKRVVGEVLADCLVPEVGTLTGFENHRGLTVLGPHTNPLGRIRVGTGNGEPQSKIRGDGALTDRVLATYLHGPVLARNPALADHIIGRATGQQLDDLDVPDQDAVRKHYLRSKTRHAARFTLSRQPFGRSRRDRN